MENGHYPGPFTRCSPGDRSRGQSFRNVPKSFAEPSKALSGMGFYERTKKGGVGETGGEGGDEREDSQTKVEGDKKKKKKRG